MDLFGVFFVVDRTIYNSREATSLCPNFGIFEISSQRRSRPRWLVICLRCTEVGIGKMIRMWLKNSYEQRMVRTSRTCNERRKGVMNWRGKGYNIASNKHIHIIFSTAMIIRNAFRFQNLNFFLVSFLPPPSPQTIDPSTHNASPIVPPPKTSKPPLPQPKSHPFRPHTLQPPHRLAPRRRLARFEHRTPVTPLQRFIEIQEFDRGVLGHQFIFLRRSRGAKSRDPIAVGDGLHRLRFRGAEVRGDGWEEGRP